MTKGFITLEYILLFASVLSVLSLCVLGIIALYNKNINAMDNYRLSIFCKELKETIELFEIMPDGKEILEPNALSVWTIEKSDEIIEIKNKNKNCKVTTSLSLKSTISDIKEKQKIEITKQNNALNIS